MSQVEPQMVVQVLKLEGAPILPGQPISLFMQVLASFVCTALIMRGLRVVSAAPHSLN